MANVPPRVRHVSRSDNAALNPPERPPMLLTAALITAPEGGFSALNPETGSTSQGETVAQALANLKEATEFYLEELPLMAAGQPLVTTFQASVDA